MSRLTLPRLADRGELLGRRRVVDGRRRISPASMPALGDRPGNTPQATERPHNRSDTAQGPSGDNDQGHPGTDRQHACNAVNTFSDRRTQPTVSVSSHVEMTPRP